MDTSLRRALRCIHRFGMRSGLQASRLTGRPGRLLPVRLRRMPAPLWVRSGTADAATFDEVFMAGEYALPFEDFIPDRILDLGANIGCASRYFAERWPRAAILAVEPAAANFELLRRNVAGNEFITPLHAAVWSRAGQVAVSNPDADPNAYRMGESPGGGVEAVPAYTVAQLLERQNWPRVSLLKMDVEGAEAEIFLRADDWLDRVDVLVVELHDRLVPGCAEALYRALHGRRFRQEIMGANLAIDLRLAG
jgi:FkbM family methyltransferase